MVSSLPRLIAPTPEVFDFGDIPDSALILTTWNENELLQGSFLFAKEVAYHPTGKLDNMVLHGSPFKFRCLPGWSLVPNLLWHRQSSKGSRR